MPSLKFRLIGGKGIKITGQLGTVLPAPDQNLFEHRSADSRFFSDLIRFPLDRRPPAPRSRFKRLVFQRRPSSQLDDAGLSDAGLDLFLFLRARHSRGSGGRFRHLRDHLFFLSFGLENENFSISDSFLCHQPPQSQRVIRERGKYDIEQPLFFYLIFALGTLLFP